MTWREAGREGRPRPPQRPAESLRTKPQRSPVHRGPADCLRRTGSLQRLEVGEEVVDLLPRQVERRDRRLRVIELDDLVQRLEGAVGSLRVLGGPASAAV